MFKAKIIEDKRYYDLVYRQSLIHFIKHITYILFFSLLGLTLFFSWSMEQWSKNGIQIARV